MQLMGGLLNVSICLVLTLGAGVEAWYLFLLRPLCLSTFHCLFINGLF